MLYFTGGINSPLREIYYYGLVLIVCLGGKKLGLYITVVNLIGLITMHLHNEDTGKWILYLWFGGLSFFTVTLTDFIKKEIDESIAEYTKQNHLLKEQAKEKEELMYQMQYKADEIKKFYHMSLELAACQDQEQVNEGLIKWAERIVECSWVALYTLEEDKIKLKKSSYDKKGISKDFLHKVGEQFISRMIKTNIPVIENNPKFNFLLKDRPIHELGISALIAVPLAIKGKNNGVLVLFKTENEFTQEDMNKLTTMSNHSATVMEVAILHNEKTALFYQTLTSLAAAIDAKDSYTKGHSEKVTQYAMYIGKELGLNRKQMESLRYASLLHDIGKIGVPDAVLNKPGRLTDDEFEVIKGHPNLSYYIVKDIDFLNDTLEGIKYHHERMDGRGYPDGLVGDQIPLIARILSVADAFDAMTSQRVYSKAKPIEASVKELEKCSGTQFDPVIVNAFINAINNEKYAIEK